MNPAELINKINTETNLIILEELLCSLFEKISPIMFLPSEYKKAMRKAQELSEIFNFSYDENSNLYLSFFELDNLHYVLIEFETHNKAFSYLIDEL